MLPFVSKGRVTENFEAGTTLELHANGEEYKLFGTILDCAYKSIRHDRKLPLQIGDCDFLKRFAGIHPYLAPEREDIENFPDCLFVNTDYVLCIDHFQINASEPRSNYDNGDEYSAFLGKNRALISENDYEKLKALLDKEGITFSIKNLRESLLYSLKKKQSKFSLYKEAASNHINTGTNPAAVREDSAKHKEVWLLIQDVSPTTSANLLFSNDKVINALENCEELDGLIYVHTPFVSKPPQSIEEFFFIRNDEEGRNELKSLPD